MAKKQRIKWDINTVVDRDVQINEATLDSLLETLRKAINAVGNFPIHSRKWEKACEFVCHMGRELVRSVILSMASLWPNKRADESLQLLTLAVDATRKSRYYRNSARRPQAFKKALEISHAEALSLAQVEALVSFSDGDGAV